MSDRVLVIIDDPFELSSVGAALRMHGVEVVAEARKKSTAINLFRSLQPNVLLIDMHKSQEHSVDIAHVIRKEAARIGVVIQIQTLRYAADGLTNAEIGRLRFVSEKAIEQVLSRVAIALNIQPDHRKNMRVQLVNEFHKWIGAPTH